MSVRSLPLQIVITVRLGAHHSVLVLQILLLDLVLTYYFEYCIIRSIISFASFSNQVLYILLKSLGTNPWEYQLCHS